MKGMLLMLTLGAGLAWGAEPYTEPFTNAASAPGSGLSLGAGSWNFTGGVAQVKFSNTSPIAIPDMATLRLGHAAFTGDYVSAGIELMGFRFRSGVALPSVVFAELKTARGIYQRNVPVSQVGVWEDVTVLLTGEEEGGWTPTEDTQPPLKDALREVEGLSLVIQRSGATSRDYMVDEWYVMGLPRAGGGGLGVQGDGVRMSWGSLRAGTTYTVQESSGLGGTWQDVSTLAATGTLNDFVLPKDADQSQSFYRLRGP